MIEFQANLTCDGCGTTGAFRKFEAAKEGAGAASETRRDCLAAGWQVASKSHPDRLDLCPTCSR